MSKCGLHFNLGSGRRIIPTSQSGASQRGAAFGRLSLHLAAVYSSWREGRIQSAERALPTFNEAAQFTNLLSA